MSMRNSRGDRLSYILDTFSWIEYFAGSPAGENAKTYIESGEAFTPTIVIAEFTDKYTRENLDFRERLKFLKATSALAPLDEETAEIAGKISAERRSRVRGWGLVDSVVLATARVRGMKVITGDEHFRGLDEAIMIK